ncbi:mitochondrial import inner membrane translocase subunit TIM8-like [Raphanus sativus]|uniref:Mitochondrial import inner membrane translocase subunit n=1 Tax=Raphanus sativus TaxID=3726 RepID=A0A6J0M9R3_RAPSA|nr:mitochondrial import inner membrane translocase subunit TIM8-like [Raphanus sativus]
MDASAANNPELLRFLNEEEQRVMMNEAVAKLTSVCWDKCLTSAPGSKFSPSEHSCLTHCAKRYADMSMLIIRRSAQFKN